MGALVDRHIDDVFAVKHDFARGYGVGRVAGYRIAQRGFAGTVGAHEHVRLVAAYFKVYAVQYFNAVGAAYMKVFDFEQIAVFHN